MCPKLSTTTSGLGSGFRGFDKYFLTMDFRHRTLAMGGISGAAWPHRGACGAGTACGKPGAPEPFGRLSSGPAAGADGELPQQDLVETVGHKARQRGGLREPVTRIEAPRPLVEAGGADPEIARVVMQRFLLE